MTVRLNNTKEIGYNGLGLPMVLFAGLALPYFLPGSLSMAIKPVGILFVFFYLTRIDYNVRIKFQQLLLILYMIISLFAMLRSNSGIVSAVGNLIYILFALLCTTITYTQKTIKKMLMACFWAGALFSLSVAVSNPFFGTTLLKRSILYVFGKQLNVNQIVYVVAIGLAVLPELSLIDGKLGKKWLIYMPLMAIMAYVILLTLSRGGFLCLGGIGVLAAWKMFKQRIKRHPIKAFVLIALICGVVITIVNLLPNQQIDRLFNASSYEDSSGRVESYQLAISSVDNIIFGDGYGAWGNSGKIHNAFINLFVNSGLVGLLCLVFMIVDLAVRIKDETVWCVFLPMIMQAMVESGDSYTFWVPYILINILVVVKKQDKLEAC